MNYITALLRAVAVPHNRPMEPQDHELPRVLSSEVVYDGKLFDVRLDVIAMNGGVEARREIIQHPGAVCMVPVDGDGRLLLVSQYRHAATSRLLELPAGTLEPGETPQPAAVRELQEEVGMFPETVAALGGFFVAPGYTTEYIHLFVCRDLRPEPLAADDDEDITVHATPLADALAMIEDGRIVDGKSVLGILRYARTVNR